MSNTLQIVHVFVHVKAGREEDFKRATIANASESVKEPGVARFDVICDREDPARFVLVEIYKSAAAVGAHKETAHYQLWRDTVADMMAEPRSSKKYVNVFPEDAGF